MPRVSGTAWPFLLDDATDRIVGIRSGDTDQYFLLSDSPGTVNLDVNQLTVLGALGEATRLRQVTDTVTGMTGATASATSLIPAGVLLLGVTTRVITAITGPTDIDIGYSGDVDAFGDGLTALTAGSTTDLSAHTATGPLYFTGATSVVITTNGGNFTAGAMRVTAHYIQLVPATS
jgi:hypothetical protein